MNNKKEWIDVQWKKIWLGVGAGIITTIVMTAAFTGLVFGEIMDESHLPYAAAMIVIVSSFVGPGISGGRGAVLNQMLVGFLYWVVLLGINAVLFDGNLSGLLPSLLMIACGTISAILLVRPRKHGNKKWKKKYQHR